MSEQPKMMNGTEWGLLIFLSVLWGGAFLFAGIAVKELPPLTVVLARVGIAALALLPVFWLYGHELPKTATAWKPYLVMGLLNNVLPFGLLFAAQTLITVGLTSIINAMTPLFTVLVMAGFGEDKLTRNRVVGVVLGVLGVAVLRGFDGSLDGPQSLGIGLGLLATLSYGFAALWGRRHLSGVAPLKSATCQLICSTIVMLFVVGLIDKPWTYDAPSLLVWSSLIGLALLGTAVAYIVFFEILVRAGASNAMLVTLLIPVTGLFLGHVFLSEEIRTQEIVGAVIIGLGLLFIDGRILRSVRRIFKTFSLQ